MHELQTDVDNMSLEELKSLYEKLVKEYKSVEYDRKRYLEEIRFYREAIENIPNAFMIKDGSGNIVITSKHLGEMFDINIKMLQGRPSLELDRIFSRDECITFMDEDVDLLEKGGIKHYEKDFEFGDKKKHPCFYWSAGFKVEDNILDESHEDYRQGIVTEFVDMTKEKELKDKLELASQIDPGTGLYNRYVFDKQTKAIIEKARDDDDPVSVMMCDLDHFKRVNDNFGHLEGDRVLKDFANIIKREIRAGDVPIRYGGEEFLVFLPGTVINEAKKVAERLREITEKQMSLPDGSNITVSIGVVRFDPKETRLQCIERADEALYTAKETGRNKVVVFAGETEQLLG